MEGGVEVADRRPFLASSEQRVGGLVMDCCPSSVICSLQDRPGHGQQPEYANSREPAASAIPPKSSVSPRLIENPIDSSSK